MEGGIEIQIKSRAGGGDGWEGSYEKKDHVASDFRTC
jgi:hypothetical protein